MTPPQPKPKPPAEEPLRIPYLDEWKTVPWIACYVLAALTFIWIGICVFWPGFGR